LRAVTGQSFPFAAHEPKDRRQDGIDRWRTWVRDEGRTAKLNTPPRDAQPPASRVLVCLFNPFVVKEFDLSGKEVFTANQLNSACGCQGLPDGNRVFADWGASAVVELGPEGRVVWRKPVPGTPNCLDRLPDGTLLIGLFDKQEVCEVKRDGTIGWKVSVDGKPTDTRRLDNGRTLVALFDSKRIVEIDREGKVVWKIDDVPSPESARRLPNGNTLVASSQAGEVLVYSPQGKVVWSAKNVPNAYDAVELENGNLLVGYARGLREIDRDGKAVREVAVGTVRRICRY
jgi:hypothetical protein